MDRNSIGLKPASLGPVGDVSPEPLCRASATATFGTGTTAIEAGGPDLRPRVKLDEPAKAERVRPSLDRRYVTAALMLVMVLASMEQTVTSTAMPTIIGELHGLEHYSWVASIYLLACTVSMPLYGRLADALGRKRVILSAIGLFLISSLLAASARSMPQLIVYRGLQGIGAGGIMPIVLTILGDIFTIEERARIQGFFSAVWGTASLAGPALGAFLVYTFGWRSIFFVNLPFGVIAAVVLAWKYHDLEKPHSTDLDLPGAVSLAFGCTALLALVSGLGPGGWPLTIDLGLLAVAVVATTFFAHHELSAPAPIMPPKLMMQRSIGPSMIGSMLLGVAFLSLDTYVPLYVQGARGGGAGAAARVVTPVMLTWALSGIVAAPLVVRWGFRRMAIMGTAIVVIGFTGLLLGAIYEWPRWTLTGVLALTGLGFGPASMSYLLAAQEAVTWQHRGVITGSVQFFRTIGGAVGIGLLGAMFNVLVRSDMNHLREMGVAPASVLAPEGKVQVPEAAMQIARHAIGSGLIWVFAAMLGGAVVGVFVSSLMSKHTREEPISAGEAMEAMAG
jgi:MFS family permease